MPNQDVSDLVATWIDAEANGNRGALQTLLADDFMGIGPVGFVLPKEIWVDRFADDLHYERFTIDETSIRRYGDAAVVVAHQHARGEAQGDPIPEDTRVTLVAVRPDTNAPWKIASIQYSFIAGAPVAS